MKEARRAAELKLLQDAGEIKDLNEQVRYELIPKQKGLRSITYVCDFRYSRDGEIVVEDVKSKFTKKDRVYIIKKKLMKYIHGIDIYEYV